MPTVFSDCKISPIILIWLAPVSGADGPRPDSIGNLLRAAVENQYRGAFSADVVMVRDSYLRGLDSLRGRLEFDDGAGKRRVHLQGRDVAFEWWSRNFGQEQWWKDENSARVRRIPHRSLKKPAFESLLTFEDLFKFPSDYLLDYQAFHKFAESDSDYRLSFSIRPDARSRYASLDVTLSKRPILLRSADFYSYDGRKLKSLEIASYVREGGKYFPSGLRVFDGDSLASVRLALFRPMAGASSGPDKTLVNPGMFLMRAPDLGLEPAEDEVGPSEGDGESNPIDRPE